MILLAKGGLAYLGPIKNVEYFLGIGIYVHERVNPLDHYIDILEEGIVK